MQIAGVRSFFLEPPESRRGATGAMAETGNEE
jgi:hypothetical protein